MPGRVAAAVGSATGIGVLVAGLAALPQLPTGFVAGILLLGLAVPLATWLGCAAALRVAGREAVDATARVAAVTAPAAVLVGGVGGIVAAGANDLWAIAVGATLAAAGTGALARHFTSPPPEEAR